MARRPRTACLGLLALLALAAFIGVTHRASLGAGDWRSAFEEAVEDLEEAVDNTIEAEVAALGRETLPRHVYNDPTVQRRAGGGAATGGGATAALALAPPAVAAAGAEPLVLRPASGASAVVTSLPRVAPAAEKEEEDLPPERPRYHPPPPPPPPAWAAVIKSEQMEYDEGCGAEVGAEMWGSVAVSGTSNVVASAEECCRSCHDNRDKGCNVWVYCGDQAACEGMYQQCWLKHQADPACPEVRNRGPDVMWTSGSIVRPGKTFVRPPDAPDGLVVGFVFDMPGGARTMRVRLRPDWEPAVAKYVWDSARECEPGWCDKQTFIYRAELPPGPDAENGAGLLQGMMEVAGIGYPDIPEKVGCQPLRRGHLAWLEGGHFEVHLAPRAFHGAAFGELLGPEDFEAVAALLHQPAKIERWGAQDARVLQEKAFFDIVHLTHLT